jgi:hypothetical protein
MVHRIAILIDITLQTGKPFTARYPSTSDVSLTGGFEDRPNLVGDPFVSGNIAANPACVGPTAVQNVTNWLNPCAFVTPAAETFGDVGRNNF